MTWSWLARFANGRSYRAWSFTAATVAAGVVIGGAAMATIPDPSGVIHACYKKPGKDLRIIDNATMTCKSSETAISWSVKGPAGPTGATGPRGPSDAFIKGGFRKFRPSL